MAHPAYSLFRYILEYFGSLLVDQDFRLAVLSHVCTFYLATQHMRHQLRPIAQAKHRDSQFK